MSNTTTSAVILIAITEDHVAGLLLMVTGLLGVFANFLVVGLIGRLPSLQNAFGVLTSNQALSEGLLLCVFTFYFAPTVMFDIATTKLPEISHFFSHFCLICYDVCIYSHLIISLNRFAAIFFPLSYSHIFDKNRTKYYLIFTWTLATVPTLYTYIIADCRVYYEDDHWNFTFKNTAICMNIAWYTDFLKYVAVVVMIALFDMITFVKVRISASKIVGVVNQENVQKRKHDDIKFVQQVCMQGVFFVLELLTYFVFINYTQNKWMKFFYTTYAWTLVHTVDGIIILAYNKGFWKIIKQKLFTATADATDTKDRY